ncbi:IPTL-CTERM sorting domain-containing protein [Desulforegula conservatrix]|uniref:IPTL-CTERM sorting domain-containing protein n=1 Tax=Desulforegula conservatrix TaxID=153026 RepID=UPI00041E8FCC|nr:IPTL-CTERM sorting domain-containing protein [Desulforegula conservatrix]
MLINNPSAAKNSIRNIALLSNIISGKRLWLKTLPFMAGFLMCSGLAFANPDYVTYWPTYNPSTGGTVFNGPADVGFLKSNGSLLIVDSNAGLEGAGEVVNQQTDGTYIGKIAANNNTGPVRVCTDSNTGDVYIATYYEKKVRRYTEAGGILTIANTWTGCTANGGFGPYNWGKVFGVAVNSAGTIYVIDYDGLRIIAMNSAGQCVAAPLSAYGPGGTGVFLNPTGIAIDSADNIYVSDYGKKVIVKYNSAGVWQQTLTSYMLNGVSTNFSTPRDIDIDPATNAMYITEGGGANAGLIKLDSSGNFLTRVKKYNVATTFSSPFGAGVSSGYIYATDYGHSSVVKLLDSSWKVSVTASAHGTVTADVSDVITNCTNATCVDQFVNNKTIVLTATPDAGYKVTWGGDGSSAGSAATYTVNNIGADKTITVTFSAMASPPTSVPTLSEWGMIILSSLLAVSAIFTMRRKRQ